MRAPIVLVFCIALGAPAHSDPDPTANWLMREPATLFDIGILRLELEAQRLQDKWSDKISVHIDYSWEENRITIRGSSDGLSGHQEQTIENTAKSLCSLFFNTVREAASVNTKTGNPMNSLTKSMTKQINPRDTNKR